MSLRQCVIFYDVEGDTMNLCSELRDV